MGLCPKLRNAISRLAREEGGQATVEYAVLSTSMLVGLVVVGTPTLVYIVPQLLNGMDVYFKNLYFVLSLALP